MIEIYRQHSVEYDELVRHEDYLGNLSQWLSNTIRWENAIVCEAGAGTGRVTSLYIGKVKKAFLFDRSQHMLKKLEANLSAYQASYSTAVCEHFDILSGEQADIFIEGWSFGHAVIEHTFPVEETAAKLEHMIRRNLKPGGTSVIIETLGTNVTEPKPTREVLATYFRELEMKYGYTKHILQTDYKFNSPQEASRIIGFFFGDEMGKGILSAGRRIIPEFTGIWIKNFLSE